LARRIVPAENSQREPNPTQAEVERRIYDLVQAGSQCVSATVDRIAVPWVIEVRACFLDCDEDAGLPVI